MQQIWIVSILENKPYKEVKKIWKFIEKEYSSSGVQLFKHPHMTFQGGKTKNPGQVYKDFKDVVSKIKPFWIEVCGVRHFNKEAIWLKVEKTKNMIELSELINDFMKEHCRDLFGCYAPEKWIPHITLAMGDLTEDNFEKAWKELKKQKIGFKQKLHNICIVRQYPDGKIKIAKRYKL